jgi:hypothetical protein
MCVYKLGLGELASQGERCILQNNAQILWAYKLSYQFHVNKEYETEVSKGDVVFVFPILVEGMFM